MQQRAAVDRLISDYTPLVRKVAAESFHADRNDPDLLQCGMIGLWEAAERWEGPPRPFTPFAKTCIRHNMIDYMRKQARWGSPVEDMDQPDGGEQEENAISRLDLAEKFAIFPPNSRERLILTALASGVSKLSIAASMDLQPATVSRIAKKAYERLQKEAPQD